MSDRFSSFTHPTLPQAVTRTTPATPAVDQAVQAANARRLREAQQARAKAAHELDAAREAETAARAAFDASVQAFGDARTAAAEAARARDVGAFVSGIVGMREALLDASNHAHALAGWDGVINSRTAGVEMNDAIIDAAGAPLAGLEAQRFEERIRYGSAAADDTRIPADQASLLARAGLPHFVNVSLPAVAGADAVRFANQLRDALGLPLMEPAK